MFKSAWPPNFQGNQLCRRLWVSNNRNGDHGVMREQVLPGMGGVSYRAWIEVQERCGREHWKEAVMVSSSTFPGFDTAPQVSHKKKW